MKKINWHKYRLSYSNIILVIILIIVFIYIYSGNKSVDIKIVKDLEILQPDSGLVFNKSWYESECQVAVYLKEGFRPAVLANWMMYIEKYPNVKYLFYYHGRNKVELIEKMEYMNFYHPIIYDPEGYFYRENSAYMDDYTFISFIQTEDIVGMWNPTVPDKYGFFKKCQ